MRVCDLIAARIPCDAKQKVTSRRSIALSNIFRSTGMSHVQTLNPSSQQQAAAGCVTQSMFESLVSKLEAQSVAHRRLENRVTELEEELMACKQELLDERARTQETTLLATRQLQEWTLEGACLCRRIRLPLTYDIRSCPRRMGENTR